MEREFEEDLLKVVGARLRRDYAVTEQTLPDPIALGLAKLQLAEQAAQLRRHENSSSEN
ncbi:hypothetical protein [Hyphomicrobium sp.]|uniref:hypothetical protein n=1 Tax=Hyphomicrobium sp. TaxID=82 RepID=UPI003F6F5765